MLIETLIKLLQKNNPQANAWIPEKLGQRKNQVCVAFSPDSRVYTYNSSIKNVADKLNLVPEININDESLRVVEKLQAGEKVQSYVECFDTIRYNLGETELSLEYNDAGLDEFDRKVVEFFLTENTSGW